MAANGFHMRGVAFESLQIASIPSPGVIAGQVFLHGQILVVAPEAYATGVVGVGIYKANKLYTPKDVGTGESIASGEQVYWNSATGKISGVATTGFLRCGICLEAASEDDTYVLIDFDGSAPTANA